MKSIITSTYLDTFDMKQCCGCSACLNSCPKKAIHMVIREDMALYPQIDKSLCINCNRCRLVCPISNYTSKYDEYEQKAFLCILNSDNERNKSSSGGAFEALAKAFETIYPNSKIAGAEWSDDFNVVHTISPISQREKYKKSKYLQSECGKIYGDVKAHLEKGEYVLFTGTPCEVSALQRFLVKRYDKLVTVDILCHGVVGNKILKKYIFDFENESHKTINNLMFRYKKKDLFGEIHSRNICINLSDGKKIVEDASVNDYLRGYHSGLFYRDSCYYCKFSTLNRISDLTIGDYWHIQKLYQEYSDYEGVSFIISNSTIGERLVKNIKDSILKETPLNFLVQHNGQLRHPSIVHPKRKQFFNEIDSFSFSYLIKKCLGRTNKKWKKISSVIPGSVKKKLKRILKWNKKY